ncbi:MAG: hypothetical protein ABIK15_13480 [Pseudomonadota bacterium]
MSKREKIIVVFMMLALIFGGFQFMGTSSDSLLTEKDQLMGELNQFIAKTVAQLNRNADNVSDYILKTASLEWDHDPFLKTEAPVVSSVPEKGVPAGTDDRPLRYSGYLQAGNRQFAIINGYEYESGDAVEPQGYVVQEVTPEKVVLETMGKERIVLSIEE